MFGLVHLWIYSKHTLLIKLFWTLILMIPLLGLLFYFTMSDPPKDHIKAHLGAPEFNDDSSAGD